MYTGGSIDEDALQHYITRVQPTSESCRELTVSISLCLISFFFLFPFPLYYSDLLFFYFGVPIRAGSNRYLGNMGLDMQ